MDSKPMDIGAPTKEKAQAAVAAAAVAVPLYIALWQLFVAFAKANIFGFGGGPSVIPLIRHEVVDNYKWLTIEEFTDSLAMGNALPGPIATKMSAYVGYKIAGIAGATSAIIGTVLPTALAMVGLASLYFKYKDAPQMVGALKAVRPVVVALLIQTVWDMGFNSFPIPVTWIILAITLLAIFWLDIHPIILIVSSMLFGIIFLAH
ncbi:chromate transporter [Desulforamulus aquiferis]|uniref:Chromate transporter n=1 Tax=Desulforamulus aquiferis TaxID=1397668 RepID=A0AAW7ZEX0_9FIRM|nr:chromate transporter [Desulforamulus aquiferis]MDO7787551.1 chromate transporter [Desulforamulus aquiferis]